MAYRFKYTGDYYVAVTGNDSNSGTSPDAPFATIQAALDAIGDTRYLTIVIGSGMYHEVLLGGIDGDGNYHNTTLQGDGEVIFNGKSISDPAAFNGCLTGGLRTSIFRNITFTNWDQLIGGRSSPTGGYYSTNGVREFDFFDCKFIRNKFMYARDLQGLGYNNGFTDCIFIKSGMNIPESRRDARASGIYNTFDGCTFLNSSFNNPIQNDGSLDTIRYGQDNNTADNYSYRLNQSVSRFNNCFFAAPFHEEWKGNDPYCVFTWVRWDGNSWCPSGFSNNVFANNMIVNNIAHTSDHTRTDVTFPYTQSITEFINEMNTYNGGIIDEDGDIYRSAAWFPSTVAVISMSFDSTKQTGSLYLEDTLGYLYGLAYEGNNEFFEAGENPVYGGTILSHRPIFAFGTEDTGSNPFHTSGGATWDNIVASGSGLMLSSSTPPSGTIESAVIDQEATKTVQSVKFNWSTNSTNQGVLSYYTASEGGHATLKTYQMRYGDTADLSSEEYKVFPINEVPHIDVNESGSGDINFITGSVDVVRGRYLQLKLTLRNDWNGG